MRWSRSRFPILFLSLVLGSSAIGQEHFSEANRLLFLTDHLREVSAPTRLHYRLSVDQPPESAFEDDIELHVTPAPSGQGRDVEVDYLTGERHRHVPTINHARGNPVVMLFLQRDVNAMARATGASARAFQRSIKTALEDEARVEPASIDVEGKSMPGTKIVIEPFDGPEFPPALRALAQRRYEFVLSEAVPGWVYRITTFDTAPGPRPQAVATLRFGHSAQPGQ